KQSGRTRNASSTRLTSASLSFLRAAKKRGLSKTARLSTLQLSGERFEPSRLPMSVQFLVGLLSKVFQFLRRGRVFQRGVIRRINFYGPECNNRTIDHHADVFASQRLF